MKFVPVIFHLELIIRIQQTIYEMLFQGNTEIKMWLASGINPGTQWLT